MRKKAIPLALVLPGATLAVIAQVLKVEAIWLFMWFGVIFTLATLLLTWTFAGWASTPSRTRRSPFDLRR
ncbi:MAG: hypothetical protein M1370_10400 [Bacteroidetes bacterium]|nr:hypothetical protein [Bacteroidota bacterium]MCL5025517.1 hypothetical protein [Chloroflexota bacterium]